MPEKQVTLKCRSQCTVRGKLVKAGEKITVDLPESWNLLATKRFVEAPAGEESNIEENPGDQGGADKSEEQEAAEIRERLHELGVTAPAGNAKIETLRKALEAAEEEAEDGDDTE